MPQFEYFSNVCRFRFHLHSNFIEKNEKNYLISKKKKKEEEGEEEEKKEKKRKKNPTTKISF